MVRFLGRALHSSGVSTASQGDTPGWSELRHPHPGCGCPNPGRSPTCGVVPSPRGLGFGISLTGPWRLPELGWRRLRHAEATATHLPGGSTRSDGRAFTT